jgi:hypothetical protein
MRIRLTMVGIVVLCLSSPACHKSSLGKKNVTSIVGTWIVQTPEAPFPYHMFVFHADGTMQQSNPDAGDPNTSDSNGFGVWVTNADTVRGKFVEVMADRSTRHFVSRGEISFSITVMGDAFTGRASAIFYDANGQRIRGPLPATLTGERVTQSSAAND